MPRTKTPMTPTSTPLQVPDETPPPVAETVSAAPETPSPETLFDPAPPEPLQAEPTQDEPAVPSEEASDPASADAEPEAETPPAVVETPSDEPTELRLGQAIGLLHRMPLSEVQTHLEAFQGKIAALEFSPAVRDLQPRMRATEGRCAPIYFVGDDDGEPEFLIHGVEAIAAAQGLGLETVSVVVIRHGDAGAVQSYLASQANTAPANPEDDLVMAVTAYHEKG